MQHPFSVVLFLVPVAMLAAACASTPERLASSGSCELAAADSVFLAAGPVYLECDVGQPARALSTRMDVTPAPSGLPRGQTCNYAEVRFVVGRDGRPEAGTARLLRTSQSALGDAVLRTVPGWTYSPALLGGVAVRQIVTHRRVTAVMAAPVSGGPPSGPPRGANCQ
jgi:hypothetical protein